MNLLINKIREILFCHRGTLKREGVPWLLSGFPHPETGRRKDWELQRKTLHSPVFLESLCCWRGRVERWRLPNPLSVHQALVRGICMTDRKCHPISKMCGHCSLRQPPPYSGGLVPHHHHLRDQAAIRCASCRRGCCCCTSSYSSCPFLHTDLSKASTPSISLHPTVTAVPPSSTPAASLPYQTHSTHLTPGC